MGLSSRFLGFLSLTVAITAFPILVTGSIPAALFRQAWDRSGERTLYQCICPRYCSYRSRIGPWFILLYILRSWNMGAWSSANPL
ncbi:hypothetical protein BJY04DRAFT_59983 [Aspergillus karnatakaensis]|uniref:uncharacterized protein n=1 Tax=Aspergillus karnatakaensis TaxID=1810916 RepID=UPI003CCC9D7F